jgi:4-alpha-glucanotransferase
MGLFRQWGVPAGGSAGDGAYVRFPAGDLLDVVALESHRAGAFVVGEDLGTVEEQVRTELAARDILSYRLLWFEDVPPRRWPARSLGAVSTHDLPTVAGVWTGADGEEQVRLGLSDDPAATEELRDRLASAGHLDRDASAAEAIDTAHELLAGAASDLVAVSLDDALGVAERPNMPGADGLRPNWSLALPVSLDDLAGDPRVDRVAHLMAGRARTERGERRATAEGRAATQELRG